MKNGEPDLPWLKVYSGQSVDELLSLEGKYRIDSLIVAFHQAVDQKAAREGDDALSREEQIILAIQVMESEVNNGGYAQFFLNYSSEYASIFVPSVIVQALARIGCPATAEITQRAIDALGLPSLTAEVLETAMADGVDEEALDECDKSYFARSEDIAGQLFAFIKANKTKIAL